ncbi:hypothetical protein Bca4012_037429 [Brassica carinata]
MVDMLLLDSQFLSSVLTLMDFKVTENGWSDEINYLGQLSHQNLVKLIGYCVEDEQHPLLYEFMNKGSLEDHLFTNDVQLKPLLWTLRVNMTVYCYNGILSDFGLARNCPKGETGYGITRVFDWYVRRFSKKNGTDK